MAVNDHFEIDKKVVGGIRSDAAPSTGDGQTVALRLNSDSELIVSVGSGALTASPIAGVAGDGTSLVSFPQYSFRPQSGAGRRAAITSASARLGPMTVNKYHQIIVTTMCWVRFGTVTVTATYATDFPLAPGTYLYLPTTDLDYVAFIRDTADGVIAIGRAEA